MRPTHFHTFLLSGLLVGLVLFEVAVPAAEGEGAKAKGEVIDVQAPARPDALAQAEKQIRAGQAAEAESALRGWLAAQPDSPYVPEAHYLLGQARFAQGDYAGAKFFHDKVLDDKKIDRTLKALALFARAECNYKMASYHKASRQYHWIEVFYRDVRAVPHDELLFKLGMATRKAGCEDTANYWFNKVVELYATSPWGQRARDMNTKLNGSQTGKPIWYALEVGRYSDEQKALADAEKLREKGYADVKVEEVKGFAINDEDYYRLTVGRFFNRNEALRAKEDADMAGLDVSIHPGLRTTMSK
jgi:TolA-binding protein